MTDMHIPAHIEMTRRIAAQQASDVTRLTVAEQQLRAECDQHQAEYEAERARLDAELREAAEKAKEHLDRLADAGRKLKGRLTDVGYALQQHREEATEAQQTVADWCTRKGINPAELPPLPDTGPLSAIAAPAEPQPTGPLPAIEEPNGLLAQAAARANPNGAATTQVDLPAGGDQPAEGPFPGGVESPAGPRPKRPRRRPQSDRVNGEQDGDA